MHSSAGVRQPTMAMASVQPPPPPSHAMVSPPFGAQQKPAFQGTIAPGTRVMIGPIVVTVQKYLSQGGFAHVYLVTTDKPIAMPVSSTSTPGSTSSTTRGETLHVLKRMAVPDKEALSSVRSEVEVHKSLRSHPNIVHFIEASATALPGGGYEIFILMEYCSGGGIIDLMNARLRNRLSEAEVLKIFGDVAAGLSVMHHMDPPLMHRDLKVENILLAPPPRSNPSVGPTYKLCDFGSTVPVLSRRAPKSLEEVKRLEADLNMHTTLQYRAPEMVDVYQRRIIDEKADVWAMGVLLYKLCYYTTPFEENGGGPLAILNARYRFPQTPIYSQRLKELIASMLQEHSTARPTIEQVIVGIHRILGTTPPASALHYVNLVANGKQVQSLPSVVSSSSSASYSGSAADVAARALAKQQASVNTGPAAGVNKDLLEMAPSESERRRVEQEELKKRSEGITPMRRGRPNRTTNSTTTTPLTPSRTASPTKSNYIPATMISSPPSSANPSGFTDSFSPPSRPESGMHYSPSMPGMTPSNRASPLPHSALSHPVTSPNNSEQDHEASSRFPSVEELDMKYGTTKPSDLSRSRTITGPTPVTSPPLPTSSRMTLIPGLSDRAPVSALAGKFGGSSNSASNGVGSSSLPPPSVAGRWTGGVSGAASVAKRWPHQDSSASSAKNVSTSPRDSASPAPTLPTRKPYLHDWLTENVRNKPSEATVKSPSPIDSAPDPIGFSSSSATAQDNAGEEIESSDDEDQSPEDVNESVAPARKRQSIMDKSTFDERRETAKDRNSMWSKPSSISPTISTGKVKTPDWVQQGREVEESGRSDARATTKPSLSVGVTPGTKLNIDQVENKKAATIPAWDEDDEEMHFLPQPDLNAKHRYEQGRSKVNGTQTTMATQTKQYADASTSPGRNTPVSASTSASQNQPSNLNSSRPPPPVAKERKPTAVLAPKPIRTQSSKEVDGMVKRYQDFGMKSEESSQVSPLQKQDLSSSSSVQVESKTESSLVQQRKDSLISGSRPNTLSNAMPPPPISASKPTTWSTPSTSRRDGTLSKSTMKPWEKEAYEKEQVHRYGSLRSASPNKSDLEPEHEQSASLPSTQPREAQERFSGVSSLISQWQSNSSKGAPGWGTVGVDRSTLNSSNVTGRIKSKEEEDLIKRSSTISSMAGRRPLQGGRLPSREV